MFLCHNFDYIFLQLSNHFEETAYERDLRNELLGLPPRRRLKTDAVPTLCLARRINDSDIHTTDLKIKDDKNKEDIENAVLSKELQKQRQLNALQRAESAERRKEEVNRIIMMEAAKKTVEEVGVIIESERSTDSNIISYKAVLKPKVSFYTNTSKPLINFR